VYDVWHAKGGSVGGRILRKSRAIVLQQGRRCGKGGVKDDWTPTLKLISETISCKA